MLVKASNVKIGQTIINIKWDQDLRTPLAKCEETTLKVDELFGDIKKSVDFLTMKKKLKFLLLHL
jgi:hypothetical protein